MSTESKRWAICGELTDPLLDESVKRWLDSLNIIGAEPFLERDLEDLHWQVRSGAIGGVAFTSVNVFLRGAMDGLIRFDEWQKAGVQFEFFEAPTTSHGAFLLFMHTWSAWEARRKKLRIIAGSILSAVAVASATAVMFATRF